LPGWSNLSGSARSPARSELVRELAARVDEPTAAVLERALEVETVVLALSIEDRERILRALEECPDSLGDLRAVLLQEHVWRVREGIVEPPGE
jgi:hypothetical protein